MLDPGTGGLRVPPGRQLWAPHPAPTEAAAVYSLFQQEHQQQTLVATTPHRFTTPTTAATYPCGTAALLASVHPQKDVITSNYSPIALKPKLAKKRSWDDVVKVEPAPAKSPCSCPTATKKIETAAGSRSTPVSLSLVKKEPISTPTTPCQVAEVTTSVRVKQEISESSITTGTSGIPVGIAVARQRNLDSGRSRGETPPTPAHHAPPTMAQPTFLQPPPLLLAGCDDRSMWSMPHTAPHWQYPPSLIKNIFPPVEPSIPVGFQLVRDPMTGQLLLIPPTNVGVMLPCDMTSAAKTTHMSSTPQPMLAPNPGLTLIQQLSTLANPTQFSTGSLLIQHISGSNTVPHTLLPHHGAGSVLISTQQLNAEPPQLINTATAHSATAVMQLPSPAPQQCSSTAAAAAISHQSHVTTSTSTTLMTQSHTPAQIVFDQGQQQHLQGTVQTPVEQTQQHQTLTQPPQQATPSLNQQQQPSVNTLSISTTTTTTTVQQESLAVSADPPAVQTQSAVAPDMTSQIQSQPARITTSQMQNQTAGMSAQIQSQPAGMITQIQSQPAVMMSQIQSQQAGMTSQIQSSQQAGMTSQMPSQQMDMSAVASQSQAIVATVAPVQLHVETQCSSDDNDSQSTIVIEKKSQGTSPVSCLNGYSGDELDATSDCEIVDESQDATFQDAGNQTESLSPAVDNPATPLTVNGDSVDATSCSTVADKNETIGDTTLENGCTVEATSVSTETSCSTATSFPIASTSCSTEVEAKQLNSYSTVETTVVDDTMQLNGLELLSYSIEKFAKRSTPATVDNQTSCTQIAIEKVVSTETDNGATVKPEIEMVIEEEEGREEGEAVHSGTVTEGRRDLKEELGKKFDGLSLLLSALEHQKDVESEGVPSLEPKKDSPIPSHRRMMPKFTKPALESTSAVCTLSHAYKSSDAADEDFQRLLAASKQRLDSTPCEESMRTQLAELRKLYREKQRELSKLSPSGSSTSSRRYRPGRPRKSKSRDTDASEKDKSVEQLRSASPKAREGDLSPPVLEPWSALPHCSDSRIPPVLTPSSNQLNGSESCIEETPKTPRQEWTDDRGTPCKSPPTLSPIASSSTPLSFTSPHSSSSKKRKVGRPKKRDDHHHHHHHHHHHRDDSPPAAKKARCSKSALVGLLLGPKEKNRVAHLATVQHSSAPASDANKPHKIRPKLKAEVKMKLWCEEEDGMEWTNISEESKMTSPLHMKFAHRRSSVPPESQAAVVSTQQVTPKLSGNGMRRPIKSKSLPGVQAKEKKLHKEKQAAQVMHKRRSLPAMSISNTKTSDIAPICVSTADLDTVDCRLTLALLSGLPCRVLVAKGGLLYAGELAEIQAPDLYSITLDGERAHRPHIYTQEQLLNDILQEVKLSTPPKQGTRLCAFWSQQYRCLYPGTVSSNQYPDQKFVCVEFDDGDDGRIPLDDIRLLPQDYPVVEYDPNPLLTLGKRKRRISTASSEHSTKTYATAEHTLDGSLEEIDEEIHERDEAIAEDEEHKTTEGEEEEEEEEEEDNNEEGETENADEQEKMDIESNEGGENFEMNRDEKESHEDDNEKKSINEVGEESMNQALNGASGSGVIQEMNQQVHVPTEEEKERRRMKKKKREKHRLEMEGKEGGGAHKKKRKHRECCNKPHHHHKHKHHHKHHKHRSSDGSEVSNKEDGDENRMSQKVADGRMDRSNSKPLQTENTKAFKRDRQNSVEGAKSKMAAFLPAKQLWQWLGKGYRRPGAKGRCRKEFYKSIHRENETISVGDCAVFLSTGRPDRPFIGRIESMWSSWTHNMVVKVKWFYHPEETAGCPDQLQYPGALFESPHNDENDVQTISHKCEVLSLPSYKEWLSQNPERLQTIYEYNDIYYLAGYYDPTTLNLNFEPGVI